MSSKKIILLIDHFNWNFKHYKLDEIVQKWLTIIIDDISCFYDLKIRSYGGWKSSNSMNVKRYEAFAFYQKNIKSIFKVKGTYVRTTFEFADYIYSSDSNKRFSLDETLIFRKSKNYFTSNKKDLQCTNSNCELPKIKKWMKSKKACSFSGCTHNFSNFFVRVEQKQVDTAIVSDLISISLLHPDIFHCGLMSNDLDFAPAFFSIIANGKKNISLVRRENCTWYTDDILLDSGINIIGV